MLGQYDAPVALKVEAVHEHASKLRGITCHMGSHTATEKGKQTHRVMGVTPSYYINDIVKIHIISSGFAMPPIHSSEAPYTVKYRLNSTTNR